MDIYKIERETNIELLRIIAMLMIICLHYLNGSMGGALSNIAYGEPNYYVSRIAESICIIGPNLKDGKPL